MNSNLIPRSKAKTAYGLLSEVARLILEEPKCYNQRTWVCLVTDGFPSPAEFPACGTIGCVAGWVTTLKIPDKVAATTRYGGGRSKLVMYQAQDILGLDSLQNEELFDGDAARGEPCTRQYARSGASHIRRFQRKYRAQLLAKKV